MTFYPEARRRLLRTPAETSAASGYVQRASIPCSFIHHIAQRLAGREPTGVVEDDLKPTLRDILRIAHGNMRRQQHIGQGPQAMRRREWLHLKEIATTPGNDAGPQRVRQV